MKTANDTIYLTPYYQKIVIPKGTTLKKATNLPQGGWWASNWRGMSDAEKSWARNYGFHIPKPKN
jgi:hypothetical protein